MTRRRASEPHDPAPNRSGDPLDHPAGDGRLSSLDEKRAWVRYIKAQLDGAEGDPPELGQRRLLDDDL